MLTPTPRPAVAQQPHRKAGHHLTQEQQRANAKEAAARMAAKKKARRPLPAFTKDLSPQRALAIYGRATAEPLPASSTPAVDSPADIKSRLRCLYRELTTTQRAIDALHLLQAS